MSEEFLKEIADELNAQTVKPAEVPAEIAPEPAPEPEVIPEVTPEINTVNNPEPAAVEKEWWEKEETNTSETVNTEEKPSIELDDDMKLILEYKKSGKTLADFVKEYNVDDLSTWDDAKVMKEGLKEFMNLSDEELEQATYDYENASIIQKKQWAETFRSRFAEKNEQKLKQLVSSNQQNSEAQKAIAEKYNAELDQFSQQIVNKEVYGLKITDEMSKDLKKFINEEFSLQRKDGSFDIEKVYSVALWLKHGKDLVKANVTKARNEGKEQIIREVSNPSKNNTAGGRSVGSGLEAAQEAFNTLFPG
ncbi:MAG: hypothetical protein EBR34_15545 [Sphingomonadaceae bacterium]|nr:hypothetical protein [Sphingomonadaceae bacterium]